MADSLFEVKYGLKVGNTIIYAGNSDITTSGNVTVTGNVAVSQIQNGNSNVSVAPNGNVTISAIGTANVVTVTATGANIAGTANISGNANVGNLGTGTVIATTANLTTINSGLLQNGTSNVTIASGGNVSTFIGGNATAQLVVTATGANIAGTANVTGNANVGNLGAATVVATNLTGTLTTAAQPNITSVGTLSSLTVSGNILPNANITYDIGSPTARFRDLYLSGATISLGGVNISTSGGNISVPNLNTTGDIQIGGNDIRSSTGNVAITLSDKDVTVVGNLTVQGVTTTIGSENYSVADSIINLHTFANLAPLSADDGRDIGIKMHYYKTIYTYFLIPILSYLYFITFF